MGEEEEANFETLDVEREEVMTEEESEEEEGNDGAFSSRQLSRSLCQESFFQMQSAFHHWKEMRASLHLIQPIYQMKLHHLGCRGLKRAISVMGNRG